MHYLVTGGAGFIGSHLCRFLAEAGHDVTVIDDLSSGKRENIFPTVSFIEGDCGDGNLIAPLIAKADGVFHLAAIASVQRSREAWQATSRINQFATIALLDAIQKSGKAVPFVYASSAAIYGDPPQERLPIKEAAAIRPLTPYGADKAGGEHHAAAARACFNIPTLGLRFFNVYGERQDPTSPYSGVISIFAKQLSAGEPVTIFGDGAQTRDFIYVEDVVAHLNAAMQTLQQGNMPPEAALNVCTGSETSVLELAHLMAEILDQSAEIHHAPARAGDILRSVGCHHTAAAFLQVKASTPLKQGLEQTLEWIKSQAL